MLNIWAVDVAALSVVRSGRSVLSDVTFSVPTGQIVGLLGPSGCGKSTLIRAIVGAQRIGAGDVRVLGEPAGSACTRRSVGYVTQASSVYPDLTVRQNLHYFASLSGADDEATEGALDEVGLRTRADALVRDLSGGQRTRVSLAAALLGDPDVYLLDEPTVGLDPVLRRDLWKLFARLADDGRTILVSSHVMDEAGRCDRVLLMREGRIIADATPDELRRRTGQDDLEQAFLVLAEEVAA